MTSPRLIPICLAAAGFLVALPLINWLGESDPQVLRTPSPVIGVRPPMTGATLQVDAAPANVPAAAFPQDDEPTPEVLPLPPATQPDPSLIAQALPDDEPTVDDLPGPHTPPESAEDP